jgi:NHL repeat
VMSISRVLARTGAPRRPYRSGRRVLASVGIAGGLSLVALALPASAGASGRGPGSYLSHFSKVTNVASTVPGNGDVNPYGITVVPQSMGKLVRGDTLVSNFNNSANSQGTGTTIVEIAPSGMVTTFSQLNGALPGPCPGGVGLTTALTTLPGGWVVVGSLPTTDGTSATAQAGCLIVLNSAGVPVETWSGDHINGPWDLTAVSDDDGAQIFVSNVLNGTVDHSPATVHRGTVVRLDVRLSEDEPPRLVDSTVVGDGFAERTDPAALVVGPTGLALGNEGQLYVADTVNSRIAVIPFALRRWDPAGDGGTTVSMGGALNGPLGLTLAPNGNILSVNSGDGNIVETTPFGRQVASPQIDPAGAGALFGLTLAPNGHGVLFVDDSGNNLDLFGPGPDGD